MSRRAGLREETEALYPRLSYFLNYLHEDWPILNGTPENAIEQAIADHTLPLRQEVRRELAGLLERCDDDARLRDILNDGLGVNLYFEKAEEARAFAQVVERKLMKSIKSHFQDRSEGRIQ
jgi:hypothetical protein